MNKDYKTILPPGGICQKRKPEEGVSVWLITGSLLNILGQRRIVITIFFIKYFLKIYYLKQYQLNLFTNFDILFRRGKIYESH